MTLPGEPLIYSIKYSLDNRRNPSTFFRNKKFKSMIKCFFKSQYNTKTPVIIHVKFFVTPFEGTEITQKKVKQEKTWAVCAYELCDYLLSFLEALYAVLINSYKQIVQIKAEKFYSSDPRTVFKFLTIGQYDRLQSDNTLDSDSKGKRTNRKKSFLQSKSFRDD